MSTREPSITRAERARDLAGRALGAAAVPLFFVRWTSQHFGAWNPRVESAPLGDDAWFVVRSDIRELAGRPLALPIDAFAGGATAFTVELELVVFLWVAYAMASLALILVAGRRVRARAVLAGSQLGALSTLFAIEDASRVVTHPDGRFDLSLTEPWIYVPACAVLAFVVGALVDARWARFYGLALGAFSVTFGPWAIVASREEMGPGAAFSLVAVGAGLLLAARSVGRASPERASS